MDTIPSLRDYLEKSGVLEHGDHQAIQEVKRKYRKLYLAQYKRNWRKENRTVTVSMPSAKYQVWQQQAKHHNRPLSKFLLGAATAYLSKSYLVPNPDQVANLESLLSGWYTGVRQLVLQSGSNLPDSLYTPLLERIERMERVIGQALRQPLTLEEAVSLKMQRQPSFKAKLQALLSDTP